MPQLQLVSCLDSLFLPTNTVVLFTAACGSLLDVTIGGSPAVVGPISEGRVDIVHNYLQAGGNFDAQDKKQRTLVHYSTAYNQLEILSLLLEHGANPNAVDYRGWTALHLASKLRSTDAATLLISKGARLTIPTPCHGCLPIHVAAQSGCVESVQLMVKSGSGPSSLAADGYTPLHFAALGDHIEVINYLLNLDCKRELLQAKTSKHGCTATHLASLSGNQDAVRVLMSHGSDPRMKTKDGNDCYGLAAQRNHKQCMGLVAEICNAGTPRIGPGDVKVCTSVSLCL